MMRVEIINGMSEAAARAALSHCCGARKWAEAMLKKRPFASAEALLAASAAAFAPLRAEDWLEAFRHHPKIGDVASLRERFASTAHLAGEEQSGVQGASEATLTELQALNVAYEKRHGFIFIVCATGRSATEMLALLKARLDNPTATELRNAAEEQKKITVLRLEKIA